MTLPSPPLFPSFGMLLVCGELLEPLPSENDRILLDAALDCFAAARFQGADLAGLSKASLRLVGTTTTRTGVALPITGIAGYWPAPTHGRLSTDSAALARLGAALAPFLSPGALEAHPKLDDDLPRLERNVNARTVAARQYNLPLALSAHERLAARAWLETINAL